jgi:hypothetical protein
MATKNTNTNNVVNLPLTLEQQIQQAEAEAAAAAMAEGLNKPMMRGYTLPNELFIVNHATSSNGSLMLRLESVNNSESVGTIQLFAATKAEEVRLRKIGEDKKVVNGAYLQKIGPLRFTNTKGSNYQLMSEVTFEGLSQHYTADPNPMTFGNKKQQLTEEETAILTDMNAGRTNKAALRAARNSHTKEAGWFGNFLSGTKKMFE